MRHIENCQYVFWNFFDKSSDRDFLPAALPVKHRLKKKCKRMSIPI